MPGGAKLTIYPPFYGQIQLKWRPALESTPFLRKKILIQSSEVPNLYFDTIY